MAWQKKNPKNKHLKKISEIKGTKMKINLEFSIGKLTEPNCSL